MPKQFCYRRGDRLAEWDLDFRFLTDDLDWFGKVRLTEGDYRVKTIDSRIQILKKSNFEMKAF